MNDSSASGYAHDAAGNMTQNGSANYAYDAESRIASIDSGATTYTYDAGGNRVGKTTGSNFTEYIYFGSDVVAEKDQAGAWTDYIFAGGRRIAKAPGVVATSGTEYYHADHLGSAGLMTNASGGVVANSEGTFLPYGQEYAPTTTTNHYKFTGKERDAETGCDYFGARYYCSTMGRFLTVDPLDPITEFDHTDEEGRQEFEEYISDPQNWNRYSYVGNSPLSHVDPDGRARIQAFWNAAQAAGRAAATAGRAIANGARAVGNGAVNTYQRATMYFNSYSGQQMMGNVADAIAPPGTPSFNLSSISRLRPGEVLTGLRLAEQKGLQLAESAHVGADFVDSAGKTYDAMGGAAAFQHFGDGGKFLSSVTDHVLKSVDFVAIDLKGASKAQIGVVKDFVKTLSKEQQDKVIYVK